MQSVRPRCETQWMEEAAKRAVNRAQSELMDALWEVDSLISRHDRLAPLALGHLQQKIGALLDYSAEQVEIARYWHPSPTQPEPVPSTSSQPTLAECPVCFELPTRLLRPCGHMICENCLHRIGSGRCPVCKQGFTHGLNVYLS